MTTIRSEARRKGLRMAAHVAALSGVLAAAAAAGQTTTAHADVPTIDATDSPTTSAASSADGLADLMRVSPTAGCGCAPCWGPPAPPAMHADLLALFDEVA